jgi:hypothetical protein
VVTKTTQPLIFKNGASVFLPPYPPAGLANLGQPDIMAESAVQLYPIGTLCWFPGLGKKYRYAKAGEALWGTKFLVANGNFVPDSSGHPNANGFYGHCQEDGVASAYPVGATEIYITDTINRVKDFFAGAHLIHFDAARNVCYEESYIVAGPDAPTTTPWQNTKLTLAEPKKYAIIAEDGIEIWCNPYSNILKGHHNDGTYDDFESFMGVPPMPVQSGYYFWLQTAGLVFITPDGWTTNCPGYTANSREAVAGIGFGNLNSALVLGAGQQRVGTVLSVTTGTDADALINLDLDLGH